MRLVPNTIINQIHASHCVAPAGQFRVICVDTLDGDFGIHTSDDFNTLVRAKDNAMTFGNEFIAEDSGQTMLKVYVFDNYGRILAEEGSM